VHIKAPPAEGRRQPTQLTSLNFPTHFFIPLILAQGMLALLLVCIAAKQLRCAAYLLTSALAVAAVALAADVTDVGLLLGETLPFYATIFILVWNGVFAVRAKDASSAAGRLS
jgi:hypothetical protein